MSKWNEAQNVLQMAIQIWEEETDQFEVAPITLSVLDLHLKSRRPSCHATPCQVNTLRSLFTPMMPFICCPSWMNGVLGQRGKDFHGCEHLPVLQRHTKLLANAGVWQNVCVCWLRSVQVRQACVLRALFWSETLDCSLFLLLSLCFFFFFWTFCLSLYLRVHLFLCTFSISMQKIRKQNLKHLLSFYAWLWWRSKKPQM